jgi:tagatose-1,6-bisphosphate aldolase
MNPTLTIGKLRGLQQCATPRGALAILAFDHRGNLKRSMRPDDPECVKPEELSAFKEQAIGILGPAASAVLLDPEVGAAQCIASHTLPGHVGLVVSVEASGYIGDRSARRSRLQPGWSVAQIKRLGASAVKLLVYYHPDSTTAGEMASLVQLVAADCATHDIAFVLEALTYSIDPARKSLPAAERRAVVVETARQLVKPGVDVYKAEFPVDVTQERDEREWAAACAELSEACVTPWVLLSASVDFATYLRQAAIACQAGASGVAVGRAVWKEAVGLSGSERKDFLSGTALDRMQRITGLCDALAQPWFYSFGPSHIDAEWFKQYLAH